MRLIRFGLLLAATLALASDARADDRLDDAPESTAKMLGLSTSLRGVEEISGAQVTAFRLYLGGDRSLVTWKIGTDVFVYEIGGEQHGQRARDLLRLLREQGVGAFIAARKGDRRDYLYFREVIAMQISATQVPAKE